MKRFTDTEKWRDEWFMDLTTPHKMAWLYMLDRCDAIGHWKQNFRLANFEIGEDVNWEEFRETCGDRIHVTSDGYWFVVAFVEFQYGELKDACRPHQSYIRQIEERNLQRVCKGYSKGIYTLKEKEKEKEKEQDKEKDTEKDTEKEQDRDSRNRNPGFDTPGTFGARFDHCAAILSEIHPKWTPAGIGNRYRQQAHEDEGAFLTVTDDELADIVRFYQRPPKGETLCKSLGAILASLPTQRDRAATWAQFQPSVNGSALDEDDDLPPPF